VKPPRIKEALAALECEFMFRTRLPSSHPKVENNVVFGKVVGVYIDDSIIDDGMVQMDKYRPLARLGYMDYTIVENVFAIDRPDHDLADYDKSGKL
jgi:flavin reductase (DIM6/NTAB) family NADH-FMN oxidoreductase RutF